MVQKFLVLLVIAAIIVVIEGNGMEVILTKVPTGCESAEKVAIGNFTLQFTDVLNLTNNFRWI